jgi:hypothetical protein
MLMSAIGALLIVLGLFCGGVLAAVPLGLLAWSPGLSLWVMFPLFSIAGYAAFVMGAGHAQIRWLSALVSALLLLLAAAAAVGLVLVAASALHTEASMAPLWYVLVIGLALGGMGAATMQKVDGHRQAGGGVA